MYEDTDLPGTLIFLSASNLFGKLFRETLSKLKAPN